MRLSTLTYNRVVNSYIGLGSNVGEEPADNLRKAVAELSERGLQVLSASSPYDTAPVDTDYDAWFVNAVVAIGYDDDPERLLRVCRDIESAHGRVRSVRNAPRTLDLDVLMVADRVVRSESLIVPHPRMHLRRFVLEPMVEIAPTVVHPVLRRTMEELLAECPDPHEVRRRQDALAS